MHHQSVTSRSVVDCALIGATCLALVIPGAVFAHQTGVSFEKEIGAYFVDIGYDPPQPQGGERIVFDFNLKSKVDKTPEDFDYVWVRLEKDKSTLLATGIARADFGPTSLLYQVPNDLHGDLTVNVRYQKGDQALAETEFTIPVASRARSFVELVSLASTILIGAALAILIMYIFVTHRKQEV